MPLVCSTVAASIPPPRAVTAVKPFDCQKMIADDQSKQVEGGELLLQVGLSGRFVSLHGVMDSMTVLDIKHQARDEVAKLLGKEFLSTELMSLLPGEGVEALKNEVKVEEAGRKFTNNHQQTDRCHSLPVNSMSFLGA